MSDITVEQLEFFLKEQILDVARTDLLPSIFERNSEFFKDASNYVAERFMFLETIEDARNYFEYPPEERENVSVGCVLKRQPIDDMPP